MQPGTITYENGKFAITCPPHVAIKLRRVFGGAQRLSAGHFTLTASPSNAHELEWFRQRHPLDLDPSAAARFVELVATEERKLATLAELERADYTPREFTLALPPREYQREAADLALRTGQLLIADDLGLGKTVSAICTLTAEGALPALVVTMTHLPRQWAKELSRFAPALRVHRIRSGKPYPLDKIKMETTWDGKRFKPPPGMPDVLIINYAKLDGWADVLADLCKTVIFDEIQELRHDGSRKYAAATAISHAMALRIGLSATPIYNYGAEIYSVLRAIAPTHLGTWSEFYDEWCGGANPRNTQDAAKVRVSDPAALGTYLRECGLMIRRTRKEVGRDLPSLTVIRHVVECDEDSIKSVADDVAELARRVLERNGTGLEMMRWSGEIDYRMRQATGIAKASAVIDFVRLLVDAGERVVLYGWHHECFGRGTRVLMFDGSTRTVEDIQVGDVVMGPDSTPRKVLQLTRGVGPLYRITPTKGEPWICSRRHLLALQYRQAGRTYRPVVPAEDFYAKGPRARRDYHLFRAGAVTFGGERVEEPWLLGYWLGDGNSDLRSVVVSTADREVVEQLGAIAARHGLRLTKHQSSRTCAFYRFAGAVGNKGGNPLLTLFKSLGLHNDKHIPPSYLRAPIDDRRALLAGLLDSDGHVEQDSPGNACFTSANKRLADEVAFLARSLGIAAYVTASTRRSSASSKAGTYYAVTLSGDLTVLPTVIERKRARRRTINKDVLHVGLDIEPAGDGEFFGFETDGDHLFLLGDFTVVHNCYAIWRSKLSRHGVTFAMYSGEESEAEKAESVRRFCAPATDPEHAQVLIISLRSGAGLDGLQHVCRTVVIGELDWSPQVMHQDIGRVHRDGQTEPVMAYYCVAEEGSDPVIADVLGIKEAQAVGIIDPDKLGSPQLVGAAGDHIKRLAEDVLRRRGRAVPERVHVDTNGAEQEGTAA